MKLAKLLWISASFYLLFVGFVYIFVLKDAPAMGADRLDFINDNWSWYAYQWRAEFLIAIFLSISSFLFSRDSKNVGFPIIAAGQLLVALAFPISIGSTPEASYELYSAISEATRSLITFGMVVSLGGYIVLYSGDTFLSKWLRVTAIGLASISLLIFGAGFIGRIGQSNAHRAMLIVMLLYLINGYYGIKFSPYPSYNK
ncbi:MAG: hypothetical protein AB3N14_13000 [Flavobacteriaceae bacterium]